MLKSSARQEVLLSDADAGHGRPWPVMAGFSVIGYHGPVAHKLGISRQCPDRWMHRFQSKDPLRCQTDRHCLGFLRREPARESATGARLSSRVVIGAAADRRSGRGPGPNGVTGSERPPHPAVCLVRSVDLAVDPRHQSHNESLGTRMPGELMQIDVKKFSRVPRPFRRRSVTQCTPDRMPRAPRRPSAPHGSLHAARSDRCSDDSRPTWHPFLPRTTARGTAT